MWWLFEKISDTAKTALYAYSRETRDLDGQIIIDKRTREIMLLRPCASDCDSQFSQDKAIEKAYIMIRLNYPDHWQVACD